MLRYRVHAAAEDRHRLAHQPLRLRRGPRAHDHAGALVADGHRLVQAGGEAGHRRRRDAGGDDGVVGRAGCLGRAQVGAGEQQALVGRIDRRGLHPDEIPSGFGSGVGIVAIDSSRVPSAFTVEGAEGLHSRRP
jgi:hypothetical protein